MITTAIGPQLLRAVHTQAEHASLRLLPVAMVGTLDLRYGHVDLDIGSAGAGTARDPVGHPRRRRLHPAGALAGTGRTSGRER